MEKNLNPIYEGMMGAISGVAINPLANAAQRTVQPKVTGAIAQAAKRSVPFKPRPLPLSKPMLAKPNPMQPLKGAVQGATVPFRPR